MPADALSYLKSSLTAMNECALVTITDKDGVILFANERFASASGYAKAELVGSMHSIVNSGENPQELFEELWRNVGAGRPWSGEISNRRKDGTIYWTETTIVPIVHGEGRVVRHLAVHHDISAHRQARDQLRVSQQRMQNLLNLTNDWYWEQDQEFRFTHMSEGITRTGKEPSAYIGTKRWDQAVPGDEKLWHEHIQTLEARKPFRDFEYRVQDSHAPGRWRWFSASGDPAFDPSGAFVGYRGIGRDITVRRAEQENLWKLANLDTLTGLPNRVQFTETLDRCIEKGRRQPAPFALVIIDLDNFKVINDSMGVAAGDAMLRTVAERLSGAVRQTDFIARIAGDEFALIINGAGTEQDLYRPLETVIESVQTPDDGVEFPKCNISMGVSLFPADAQESSDMLKHADIALQRAKADGGSQYVLFRAEHKTSIDRQAAMLREVESAIKASELTLHYQPIVNPVTRKVLSLEALLRWKHPTRGLLTAGSFQDVFGNMPVSARIGKCVTEMAVRQAAQWKEAGVMFSKVAINVTAADFVLGGFPVWLASRLAHYGLGAEHICIEVTEGMFLGASAEPVLRGLHALNGMGAEIAFDDFGTGYASLMHLRMPIDRLKIDRSFVHNIENDSTNTAIVQAVVQLGHNLGKSVTVEGVETHAQSQILQQMGCRQFQGYLYSRPLPATDIPAFIEEFGSRAEMPVKTA